MPRRSDTNQPEIVEALRAAGCLVWDTHELGHGAPDVLCLCRGELFWLEVKSAGGKLTPDEQEFHDLWRVAARGPVFVVRNIGQAMRAVGVEVV